MLSSALQTADADAAFHVLLGSDVDGSDRARLADPVTSLGASVHFQPVDESAVAMLPSKGPALGGRMSWVRVVLDAALPDLDRVIYLDADTLVRESVRSLWELDLEGAPIAAVRNVTDPAQHPHVRSLGIEDARAYFNAGVLVTDLAAWRAADASERMIRFATSRPLPWFDQDALNVVFAGQWKALDARWNAMNSLWTWPSFADDTYGGPEADAARQRPAILHFEGPLVVKPWHFLSPHPWRAAYRETLGQTAWADVPLAERTLATRAIARLPEQRWLAAYHRWHVARRRLASARRRMAHIFSRAA